MSSGSGSPRYKPCSSVHCSQAGCVRGRLGNELIAPRARRGGRGGGGTGGGRRGLTDEPGQERGGAFTLLEVMGWRILCKLIRKSKAMSPEEQK